MDIFKYKKTVLEDGESGEGDEFNIIDYSNYCFDNLDVIHNVR